MNPRSVYNKVEEFHAFMEEEMVDLLLMSESWERENLKLNEIIKLEDHEVISNVYQRTGVGGRPAIIVNKKKYSIRNLTNTLIQVPWGVEAVWCLLTPKNLSNQSKIQNIACCALYSKPGSKKKSLLLDHISESFSILSKKFGKGLHFVIAGDSNDLKLDSILSLSPKMSQIVQNWTRLNPPAILDPILTTLSNYYQVPLCLDPLDPDPDKNGKASDHKIVLVKPITVINNRSARKFREIKVRPFTDSGMEKMRNWFMEQSWDQVFKEESANEKANIFQQLLLKALDDFFPEKIRRICNEDQVWITHKLKLLDRKRKRVFHKERRSEKWKSLNKLFKQEIKSAKSQFYRKTVADLKQKSPGQWYSSLKRITSMDQQDDQINVDEISNLTDQEQAEKIADKFSSLPNQYEALKKGDITVPPFCEEEVPQFHPGRVWQLLSQLKTNKATVVGDFPAKLSKHFAAYIAEPLTDIINTAIRRGEYPQLYKYEVCTPVPKCRPPKTTSDLRNISGLLTFDKIMETLISEIIISDMSDNLDPSQYGNQRGLSIQHYLIGMLHRILTALDNNSRRETFAVVANMIDWDNAFPRQCAKLGVESFMNNGVRPALIPVLINYFQDRQMVVKWHGCLSVPRKLAGGGPQGATLGLLEYLSQSNHNADFVSESDRFKFIDDLTVLEIINLLTVGISCFNLKQQVASDLATHNQFIDPEQLESQKYLDQINEWTKEQKMKINEKKTKYMIFNFTQNYQFSTRLKINNQPIEMIEHTRLLGTIVQNNLSWDLNTKELVRKANARMELLRKVSSFSPGIEDLKTIYIMYVRSILEHSATLWHSSLSKENRDDLERVQKTAFRIILGERFKTYKQALQLLDLQTLDQRREQLCLTFAKRASKHPKFMHFFPLNQKFHQMNTRNVEKYKVQHAHTERLKKSAIIYMQNILNEDEKA